MEDIFAKSIQESQLRDQIIKSNISEGLTPERAESMIISNFEKGEISEEIFLSGMNILEKAKKGNIGEIREWKSGKYRKTVNGWEPVKGKESDVSEKRIPGISEKLNDHIFDLLKYDEYNSTGVYHPNEKDIKRKGVSALKYLKKIGLIDSDDQFVEPEKLKGDIKIASEWLRDNI